jgi:hypothetical protein
MANYTKNDMDVKLLNNDQRVEYEFEFLKHNVHDNLDLNKTVQGIDYLRKSQDKGFKRLMVEKDEEAGEKYRIVDKILMILMMVSVLSILILGLVYIGMQVYKIVMRIKMHRLGLGQDANLISNIEDKLQFVFVIVLVFILLIIMLLIANKGFNYVINYIKVTRKFLHRV